MTTKQTKKEPSKEEKIIIDASEKINAILLETGTQLYKFIHRLENGVDVPDVRVIIAPKKEELSKTV